MGRTVLLLVTSEQRRELEELAARRNLKQGHAQRVRVVLLAADGVAGVEIARRVGLSALTASRGRRRVDGGGGAGLSDRPKPGRGDDPPPQTVRQILSAGVDGP